MNILLMSAIMKKQRISVPPAVFETGTEDYIVIFESELKGSGYVRVQTESGDKIYYDSPAGIIATHDTVHVVKVPKNVLRGNCYSVGSQHVPFKYDYSAIKGGCAETAPVRFKGEEKEDGIKLLLITDIHEREALMRKSLAFFKEDYDMVVMLGDITSNFMKKEKFTKNILSDAAELSGGTVPVVYTRGNHETRGEFASQLLKYFPTATGEFYFTFDFGGISAVVLDSGEDKEDDHSEYSGLIDFHTYREKEYKWISSLKKEQFTGKYKLVFCHHPGINQHFRRDWLSPFKALGFGLLIGGHYHISRFIETSPPAFVACGRYSDGWAASSLTLENGKIRMLTINTEGETLLDKTITVE